MFMDRKLVLFVALVGTTLAVVALVLLNLPLGLGNGSHSPAGLSGWGFLIYILGVLGGGALVLASGVIALVQTAQRKRWSWFGVLLGEGILLLGLSGVIGIYAPWAVLILPLTLVIYGVVGPTTPAHKRD
jgi:hypothetical protein